MILQTNEKVTDCILEKLRKIVEWHHKMQWHWIPHASQFLIRKNNQRRLAITHD